MTKRWRLMRRKILPGLLAEMKTGKDYAFLAGK